MGLASPNKARKISSTMKKDEVYVGGTYLAKVTDKVVPVRLDAENRHGGWDATNLATGKKVRIKSAQRLRGLAPKRSGLSPAAAARADRCDVNQADTPVEEPSAAPEPKPAGKKKSDKPAADKGLSCLDAAVEVLKSAGEPMQCKAMIDAMQHKGLWTSDAPTPAATLYSAILREIQKKGTESRFRKTQRGHFTLNAQ